MGKVKYWHSLFMGREVYVKMTLDWVLFRFDVYNYHENGWDVEIFVCGIGVNFGVDR